MRQSSPQNWRDLPRSPGGSGLPHPGRLQRPGPPPGVTPPSLPSPAGIPAPAGIAAVVVVMREPPCASFRFVSFRFASRPARACPVREKGEDSGLAAEQGVIAGQVPLLDLDR